VPDWALRSFADGLGVWPPTDENLQHMAGAMAEIVASSGRAGYQTLKRKHSITERMAAEPDAKKKAALWQELSELSGVTSKRPNLS
jgi:hypothetical protein